MAATRSQGALPSSNIGIDATSPAIIELRKDVEIGGGHAQAVMGHRELLVIGSDKLSDAVYVLVRSIVDVTAAAIGLIVTGPFLLLLCMVIVVDSPGSPIYRQVRVGRDGRSFQLYKLRTMVVDAEEGGPRFTVEDDPRITRVGRFLRRTRFDELPQLWNVLRGEMALIGPRPERPEFVREYLGVVPRYGIRHVVRPGLTGWAQVTEGYTLDAEGAARKFERDLYYLTNRGPSLDVRIVVETVKCMTRGVGR